MFTGLIEGIGDVVGIEESDGQRRIAVRARHVMARPTVGESIAVDGVCLTAETCAERAGRTEFAAFASAETLRRTTLGGLKVGDAVNLERALALGDRLGGHIVTGHVDAVGTVTAATTEGRSLRLTVAYPERLAREIVARGSVALDGISLTVNGLTRTSLVVNVIPETRRATTAGGWAVGRRVNVETDILGKYACHVMRLTAEGPAPDGPQERAANAPRPDGVTLEMLRENGFM